MWDDSGPMANREQLKGRVPETRTPAYIPSSARLVAVINLMATSLAASTDKP